MTKDLAMKHSWSGLGAGRKKIKTAFKESAAFDVLKGEEDSSLLSDVKAAWLIIVLADKWITIGAKTIAMEDKSTKWFFLLCFNLQFKF